MKKPELLSPAGTIRNMRYAFAYGADAVYAGMPRYSLRVRNNDFLEENLRTGIDEAHAQGKQFFVAANAMPHGAKLRTFIDDIRPVIEMGPDALIMADPGLILLVREQWPEMPIHLSVQANTTNAAGVRFWQKAGVSRVILSRELSLDEIAEIRQQCPDMELEVFVHGALCIAYSGRCLLSGYFNHRDANQGTCTNACRWEYNIGEIEQSPEVSIDTIQRHPKADDVYYIEERGRPGELMPIMEDEMGTYIMNSKDLRAVEHVQRLVEIGIDCLKIEGRTKSHYYTARTTQVYRRAIDDAVAGNPFNPQLLYELEGLANRGYTDGFYQRHESRELQNYRAGVSKSMQQQFVAEVLPEQGGNGLVSVIAKNKFRIGDELELLTPASNYRFNLEYIEDMQGQRLEEVPGGGYEIRLKLPVHQAGMGLITRYL
ncbi:MAG: tRNA 5-hydroxyuridine modification protein YegQ [Sedimenticolaceae bacterium]|nr:tRNA 5-hydroxyuridine modification protein YegQ [Sedimenticolaceae bacterium]